MTCVATADCGLPVCSRAIGRSTSGLTGDVGEVVGGDDVEAAVQRDGCVSGRDSIDRELTDLAKTS